MHHKSADYASLNGIKVIKAELSSKHVGRHLQCRPNGYRNCNSVFHQHPEKTLKGSMYYDFQNKENVNDAKFGYKFSSRSKSMIKAGGLVEGNFLSVTNNEDKQSWRRLGIEYLE